MDVKPIGSHGLTGVGAPGNLPKIAPLRSDTPSSGSTPAPHTADVVSVLQDIHPEDTQALLTVLEGPDDPLTSQQTAALVTALVDYAQAGGGAGHAHAGGGAAGAAHVDQLVRQIAQQSPAVAETLPDHAALTTLRSEIASAVRYLEVAGKADAEHAVGAASSRIPDLSRPSGPYQTEPKTLIELCEKLIAFGGLANYRKAERLATSIAPNQFAFTDVTETVPLLDARGLPRHWPKQLDLLPRGPAAAGLILLIALLLILAAYLFR